MGSTTFQRAFAGGELAPALHARADNVKYLTGLKTCRNWIILRHGGVANRPGTRFINECKTTSTATFLLRYVSEIAGESMLIEAGPNYLRFYKNGALVRLTGVLAWDAGTNYAIGDIAVSGGVNYYAVKAGLNHVPPNATYWYAMPTDILELPTPFGNAGFNWVQSGYVITMTSSLVRPYELIFGGLTRWIIRAIDTAPAIGPPTALLITPGPGGTRSFKYIVTSAAIDSYEESIGGPFTQVNTISEATPDNPHILNWTAPAGGPAAAEYHVYKDPYENGVFGYIGTASGVTTFKDAGFVPDFAVTPPIARILFTTANNYPARAAYYQQRRFFANTLNEPEAVWGSRIGFHSNFNVSSPLQDDDAISFKIAGNQHNPVRHLLGLKSLIVMTDGGEWTIGQAKQPISPGNIPADQETYVGVSDVLPVIVGNSILYVQARGSIMRDLRFEQEVEGLAGRDLSLFAAHLFDGYSITHMDYQQVPHSTVWATRSDGMLLGLTYLREQDIWGWHRHDTGAAGLFLDVCVVPESGHDAAYVLVRRTIGGVFKRYIERIEPREILNWNVDSFFTDSGLTYSGAPASTIAGLGHLEGQVVAVVADGRVVFNGDPSAANAASFTVAAGGISGVITPAASVIHAGLAIRFADLETLDLDVSNLRVELRDKLKKTGPVSLLLDKSVRTFWCGPDSAHLVQVKVKPHELGAQLTSFTGQEEISITTEYDNYGRVFLRQIDPLPITVLGILPSSELGG